MKFVGREYSKRRGDFRTALLMRDRKDVAAGQDESAAQAAHLVYAGNPLWVRIIIPHSHWFALINLSAAPRCHCEYTRICRRRA